MAADTEPNGELLAAIDQARADTALGRSQLLRRLFDYLAQSSLEGRSPKEAEVAIEVFGRQPDFDPTRDAVARVYVHKLRRRLEEIERAGGARLTIPRGEYRLALNDGAAEPEVPNAIPPASPSGRNPSRRDLLVGLSCAGLAGLGGWGVATALHGGQSASADAASAHPIWRAVRRNGHPIVLALGDYYIFADMHPPGGGIRLVREYTVNSPEDLGLFIRDHPDRAKGYTDLGLNYLPEGAASAIMSVARVLGNAGDVRISPISHLNAAQIRDANIVYVGYLSGLGLLRGATFAGSRYSIGDTWDVVIDNQTHQQFESGGGTPHPDGTIYPDYGYFSTFAGPAGDRIIIIAGTRDTALTQMGQTSLNPAALDALMKAGGTVGSAESLYSIRSMSGTNVDSSLIRSSALNQPAIWNDDVQHNLRFPSG